MTEPIRVAVTGAAGQIGYSLLFRIANGEMLGPNQPVKLQLLELPQAKEALDGVAMELVDCAFPMLHGVETADDPRRAFEGADLVLLVGSKPRQAGMERADLIRENGPIFVDQGKAIDEVAADDARVLVVGNPCNTNCLIAANQARRIPKQNFTAMTRLDHNRAVGQLALAAGVTPGEVHGLTVWGNHSPTMVPDVSRTTVHGQPVREVVDTKWLAEAFDETVRKRGKAIIDARGKSSAASAANAAIDHVHDWFRGTAYGAPVSMAVLSKGEYGIPEGLFSSFPCRVTGPWQYEIVEGLELDAETRQRIDGTVRELEQERETISDLL